ncbi:LysR family transcriptional regulator [Polaromonas sp. YR568]|uniref:LysR family transcriptional regulator n=1 Tax=Polaromonas sp. YR568 TaxID=1855301 RepID=UPI00398BCAB5
MDWDDIKVFLAIARAGSLGGAANALGQTQPTMGRRLRAFEEKLGVALFQRSSEGFVLTDEGASVMSTAERMEQEALAFERTLEGGETELEGLLRVSASDWFGLHVLAPVFARFQEKHPRVSIDLITESRLLSLARREADLVFRIRPFEESDVVQRRLTTIHYAVYGASQLEKPWAGDGQGTPLITMNSAFSSMPDVRWLQRMLPNAHTVMRSNNREVQAAMCVAGRGWAVLPVQLGDHAPGLVRADLGEAPPGRDVWVGFHQDLRRLARLRRLLEFTVEAIPAA